MEILLDHVSEFCPVQINDGLTQTAACASSVVYDKSNGLVFVSYMTGIRKRYGESTGKLCLSVFPPAQPTNIRHVTLDVGVGASRGLLCTALYLCGDRRVRALFTTTRGTLSAYAREYDFESDTVSDRTEIFLRMDDGRQVTLNNRSYREFMESRGFSIGSLEEPIINKISEWNGKRYTAVTLDGWSYPVLCEICGNILVPFAICPELNTYESRFYLDDSGIFGMSRVPPDDCGTGHAAYFRSRDGGATWAKEIFDDGVQSRPDILRYEGKPLILYNYKSEREIKHFPRMHHDRNAIRAIYEGKTVLELFSRYGIVEHETISIAGDLYMTFSDCPQALSTENGKNWSEGEDRHAVEQGKEVIRWMKIGRLDPEE